MITKYISSSIFFYCIFIRLLTILNAEISTEDMKQWADLLGEDIYQTFRQATKADEIISMYKNLAQSETFDPRAELKKNKQMIEEYLRRRAKMAWDAKISLEVRLLQNLSSSDLNDPTSVLFVRFMSAKMGTDRAQIYLDGHQNRMVIANETQSFNFTPNANFYGLNTSNQASAVHVPTPIYNRNSNVLSKISWSNIDEVYRSNRHSTRDLAFQLFCSESGFMRYFPAAPWVWDNPDVESQLDLFDCRSTEWYINGATLSKNVIIMLDMSGSMLGQRFEIAKQTIEAILETLSDNDFFNIMPFSKSAEFLDACANEARLLQATVRNKKLLRSKLNNVTSEGKAEYEIALKRAFETLMNLPKSGVNWTSTDEMLTNIDIAEAYANYTMIHTFTGRILVYNDLYLQAITNFTGNSEKFGCNNVIMLITDGAPDYFKDIFQLYNREKKIRFFSFLIGEEALDFDQVKWMACTNKGFMVHISNLADVQEKVQHYIKVMSRPLGEQGGLIEENDAVWSGVYRERLYLSSTETPSSNEYATNSLTPTQVTSPRQKKTRIARQDVKDEMFVTTVSYPVVYNGTFMGVVGVNVPISELEQLACNFKLGAKSYNFMLDNNGYVMFHPQLRPIDRNTKQPKPNYNSMDILELEVPQNQELLPAPHRYVTTRLDYDSKSRIYRQTNTYYAECIDGALFTVGVSVAKGDENRLVARNAIHYAQVQLSWLSDKNWRIHPQWRYCLLNDSDSNLSVEDAFVVYMRHMRDSGKLPPLCMPRRELVDRLLLDAQATDSLGNYWELNWDVDMAKGVHLVYFATPSGLIRFADQKIPDIEYSDPTWTEADVNNTREWPPQQLYSHFVSENAKSSQDVYYRRAIRMKNRVVIDINLKTKVWYTEETMSAFGHRENVSLLLTAAQALYLDGALVGVAGVEMLYDSLAQTLKNIGACGPGDDQTWCFLLDEHAYIVYSSLNTSQYSYPFSGNVDDRRKNYLGKFFGHVNRITERTMALLFKKNFYTRATYVDYQALCMDRSYTIASGSVIRPLLNSLKALFGMIIQVWHLLRDYTILGLIASILRPIEAYTTTFHDLNEGLPCDKASDFYLANWNEENWDGREIVATALIDDNLSERPCKHNAAKCAVKMFARWVPRTNLLLVAITQNTESTGACYDDSECPISNPPEFQFGFTEIFNASDKQQMMSMDPSDPDPDKKERFENRCRHLRSKERKAPTKCFASTDDESEYPCSTAMYIFGSYSLVTMVFVILRSISRYD